MVDNNKNNVTKKKDEANKKVTPQSNNGKTIAIAILSTALVCIVVMIAVLLCTGVVKFNSSDDASDSRDTPDVSQHDKKGRDRKTDKNGLIDNPYDRVKVNGRLAEVDDLEFYLPYEFEAGGKNKDGAYTYNLTDDDGWAQVLVYAEKSSLTPTEFLKKISSYLDFSDEEYEINGTKWVEAENASILAYATKLAGKVYAVYYSVKLDSKATGEAMQMIPKTLYMKKIEADE